MDISMKSKSPQYSQSIIDIKRRWFLPSVRLYHLRLRYLLFVVVTGQFLLLKRYIFWPLLRGQGNLPLIVSSAEMTMYKNEISAWHARYFVSFNSMLISLQRIKVISMKWNRDLGDYVDLKSSKASNAYAGNHLEASFKIAANITRRGERRRMLELADRPSGEAKSAATPVNRYENCHYCWHDEHWHVTTTHDDREEGTWCQSQTILSRSHLGEERNKLTIWNRRMEVKAVLAELIASHIMRHQILTSATAAWRFQKIFMTAVIRTQFNAHGGRNWQYHRHQTAHAHAGWQISRLAWPSA